MTRREFGQLDRLPSGRWRARFTAPGGRLVSAPVTFTSRREAADYLARVRGELLAGRTGAVVPSTVTLAEYATGYLRTAAASLRPRTLDLYQRLTDRWLLPAVGTGARVELGPMRLSELTAPLVREWHAAAVAQARADAVAAAGLRRPSDAQAARAWALREGMDVAPTGRLSGAVVAAWRDAGAPHPEVPEVPPTAGRTVAAQAYRLLHVMLAQAVTDGLIPTNPCRVKGAATVDHPERLPLAPDQVSALADAITPRYRAAVLVATWSGLRPGEVFALRRCDVDAVGGAVSVHRALVEVPGRPIHYGPPKSAAGRRTVALPRVIADALADHLETYTGTDPEALVFTTAAGQPVRSSERARVLRPAREAIGRPDMTWHHLRHTGATLAAIAGATQAELQARIGHSTARAAAIYQHARAERDRWIADQLDTIATATPAPAAPPPQRRYLSLVRTG